MPQLFPSPASPSISQVVWHFSAAYSSCVCRWEVWHKRVRWMCVLIIRLARLKTLWSWHCAHWCKLRSCGTVCLLRAAPDAVFVCLTREIVRLRDRVCVPAPLIYPGIGWHRRSCLFKAYFFMNVCTQDCFYLQLIFVSIDPRRTTTATTCIIYLFSAMWITVMNCT